MSAFGISATITFPTSNLGGGSLVSCHGHLHGDSVSSMFRTGNRVLARHRDTFIGYWLLVPAFLVMGAILIWRSIHNVVLSLFDFRLTRRDERVSVGFDNYTRLFFHDSLFHRSFVNTAVFVALALTLIPIL